MLGEKEDVSGLKLDRVIALSIGENDLAPVRDTDVGDARFPCVTTAVDVAVIEDGAGGPLG